MIMMLRAFLSATVILSLVSRSYGAKIPVDLSLIESVVGVERIAESNAIKCTSCGFNSKSSLLVLDNLLGNFDKKYSVSDATILDDGKKFLVFNSETMNDIRSDVSFVYTHHMSLYDEESTLLNMQMGLKSITSGVMTDVTKKMLVLVVDGPQATAEYVKTILEEAWATLLDKEEIPNGDIMAQIVVHIVSVNGPISDIAKESVDSIVNDATLEGKPLGNFLKNIPETKVPILSTSNVDLGVDVCKEAVSAAIKWARDGANASLLRLQKAEAANEFAEFVERLIQSAQSLMKENVQKSGGASISAIKLAEEDIARNVFTMLGPIFRRHVLLAKQEAAIQFNAAVGDELSITINILNDLNNAKDKAMKIYLKNVKKLIPKGAPKSSWSIGFDQKQLLDSLEDYIGSRVDQLKIQGVLSRGRKPIDIAFNIFLHHPLGRDYRQNPLAAGNSDDEIIFDMNSDITNTQIVHPSLARAVLESPKGKKASQESSGWFKSSLGKKESEFAREMLMFPLSIKNPAVSLMASRFIRWDLEPLDEVKDNLDSILASRTTKKVNVIDKVLNIVPFFGKGYYNHPPVTYGNKYSANPISVKN